MTVAGRKGFFVSTTQAVVIFILFVVIVVSVGLMAGLIPDRSGGGDEEVPPPDSSSTPEPSTTTDPGEQGPWREPFLSRNVLPVHYDMYFYPDFYFEGTTYTGRETIELAIQDEATNYLIIHFKMMTITSTRVTWPDGEEVPLQRYFEYEPNQFWVVETVAPLAAHSTVFLHLEFEGSLVQGIVGFYKSNYTNQITGEDSWMATTKFQPTDARKAFPNFDEPRFKAEFTVTLRHWQNFTALSNMPESGFEDDGPVWRETKFIRSVRMSSYLVCFIVCDFNYTENTLASGVTHRIWSTPDKIASTEYASLVGKTIQDFFDTEFDMPFHLPKLDQVAVPDYPSGATEHWGLVTYRENALLYDPAEVSATGKQRVAAVIAHELAHHVEPSSARSQSRADDNPKYSRKVPSKKYFGNAVTCAWWDDIWLNEGFANFYENLGLSVAEPTWEMYFGNAVTCAWWDDIWLNEGFARFYQYNGLVTMHPDWEMANHFVITTMQGVMRTDGTVSSRPVIGEVTHPDQINQAFDGITYNKGASMLRMMENFLGKENFRNAIRQYLKDHEFEAVTTDDLWQSMQDVAGEDWNVKETMDPWFRQMGLPVVDVTWPPMNVSLMPSRFLSNPDADPSKPDSPYEYEWLIPVTYNTSDGHSGLIQLSPNGMTMVRPDGDWIKFNSQQAGFFRVNYPNETWIQFADVLETSHEDLLPVDRSNLLDDAFNLARATLLSYPTALQLTRYLQREEHYFPWQSVSSALKYISVMLYGHVNYPLWREYMRGITTAIMDRLQVEDTGSHLDQLLRDTIIELSCDNGLPSCVQNTTREFNNWLQDESYPLAPTLAPRIYEYGMRATGGPQEWEAMWERYVAASSAQEKSYLLFALAQTTEPFLISRYLEYAQDETLVRRQDFFSAVGYLNSNPVGHMAVWNWARSNYDVLVERFGTQDRVFGRMVPNMVSSFKTDFQLQEVEDFYAKYPDAGAGEQARAESLENIRDNIAWRENNEEVIIAWLLENVN